MLPVLIQPCVQDLSKYGSVTCSGLPCVEDLSKHRSVTCSGKLCVDNLSMEVLTVLIYPV